MIETTDHELLADYARTGSEAAFAQLVARYINLVHSAAQRYTGNEAQAGEITQAVFLILARKAGSLSKNIVLAGWLYQTTRVTAANALKAEARRQLRDHQAYMESQENQADAAVWREIAPLLDDAMGKLGETDRTVLVLRFFEGRTNAETAAALGLAEGAVQKRVQRALEKLRANFAKQGVTHTAQAIAGTVTTNAVMLAPVGLAAQVALIAAKGLATTTSITALVKGTLKTMTWLKYKFAGGFGMTVILAGAVATLAIASKPLPPTSSSNLEFYSFLKNPPIISKGVYKREMSKLSRQFSPKEMANLPLETTYEFRLDGSNYLLSSRNLDVPKPEKEVVVGQYGNLLWLRQFGYLQLFDLQFNKKGGDNGNIPEIVNMSRITPTAFLGIPPFAPDIPVTWQDSDKKLFGIGMNGKAMTVTFIGGAAPSNAIVSIETVLGTNNSLIAYEYYSNFCGGHFPYMVTRYEGSTPEEKHRIYTIQIQSIETSPDHLSSDMLDPRIIYTTPDKHSPIDTKSLFYSNNVQYTMDTNGIKGRVHTFEEFQKLPKDH